MREQGFEVAVGIDELGRGLDADARDARHVVGAVPAERLHLDDLVGADAEFFAYLRLGDGTVGHRVAHPDVVADELHQILVGGQDCHLRSGFDSVARVGRDDRLPRSPAARFGKYQTPPLLAAHAPIVEQDPPASPAGLLYKRRISGFGSLYPTRQKSQPCDQRQFRDDIYPAYC
jgi:hypothetical protein